MLAELHRFTPHEMFEARKILESGLAGMAAENAQPEHLASMAEEITEMYAALDDPQDYLVHDIRFHRAIAAASGNQILAALMNMVSTAMYERRRATVERATDLKESVEFHHQIYRFIRAGKADEARTAMSEHLEFAQQAFASEEVSQTSKVAPNKSVNQRPHPSTRKAAKRAKASSSKARRKS
jgi:GntR family transcriptional repressor for pyruvate dehydrogenase complex